MDLDRIGFGTYRIKDKDIIKSALQIGYRTLDTAILYKNHNIISQAIKESNIPRNQLFIISKISSKSQKSNKILDDYQDMIRNFGYIDLILLHAPVKNKYIESWKILEDLYLEKKVRYIGVSNFRIFELEELKKCRVKPYLNQIEVNPYCTRTKLVKYCQDNGIIIQAYSSLKNKIGDISAEKLLKWALYKGYYIIPMSSNREHMKQNLNIKGEDLDILDKLNRDFYTISYYKD